MVLLQGALTNDVAVASEISRDSRRKYILVVGFGRDLLNDSMLSYNKVRE